MTSLWQAAIDDVSSPLTMYLPSIFRSTTDHGPMESPDAPTSRRRSLFNLFRRRGARRRDPLEGSVPVYEPSESTPVRSACNTLRSSFKGLSLRHRSRSGIATATDTTLTLVSPPPDALDSSPVSSGEPSPVSDSTAFMYADTLPGRESGGCSWTCRSAGPSRG